MLHGVILFSSLEQLNAVTLMSMLGRSLETGGILQDSRACSFLALDVYFPKTIEITGVDYKS